MPEKPTDAHLKEVRDSLVADIVEQGRALGAPVPDVRKAEQFIDPIMRRVEADVVREADAIQPIPQPVEKTRKGGDWYGEAEHSKKVPEGAEVRAKELGTYKVGKDGIKPINGAPMPEKASMLSLVIKKLLSHPDWKPAIMAANAICDRHLSAMPGCVLCERRESKLLEIFGKAKSTFNKQRERRLIVGGK